VACVERSARCVVDRGLALGLGVPHFAARRFTACHRSLHLARRFTRTTLCSWGWGACADDAVTVVGELVAGVLGHVLDPPPGTAGWLALMDSASTVTCVVNAPDTAPRAVRAHPSPAVGGPGLHIVDALSDAWGHRDLGGAGTALWAQLSGSPFRAC
jgi:hypothetical protein